MENQSLLERFKSRKFLFALAFAAMAGWMFVKAMLAGDQATANIALDQLKWVFTAYFTVEGVADAVGRYQSGKVAQYQAAVSAEQIDDDPGERPIVAGNQS